MNAFREFMSEWRADPVTLITLAAGTALYFATVKRAARPGWFLAAMAVMALALLSPLQAMAEGVLFSAHMTQHILLLLVAPALLLASLPAGFVHRFAGAPTRAFTRAAVAIGWLGGVGSMWFWHVPDVCSASVTVGWVHALQSVSLVALGAAFWWPIFGPSGGQRLSPSAGIVYLATACLACTALGILLTLTPIQVCPIFRQPISASSIGASIRAAITPDHDQQIGGLLMWVPMCLVYLAAIMLELARWWRAPGREVEVRP